MKKVLAFLLFVAGGISTIAQDYGVQLPNSNFEADWVTYKGGEKTKIIGSETISGSEPYCWHSFMSAKGAKLVLAAVSKQISKSEETRPNSKGNYSVRLNATKTLGIVANGSLTNGRMYCGSTKAADNDNHIYTDRGTDEFNMPFTGPIPDSITVWLSYYTTSDKNYAAFHAAVHGDENFILYGNGKEPNQSMQVADANLEYPRTTTSKSTLGWERKSIPFVAKGQCTEPKYLLVTMSTNKTPGSGSEDDLVYVDDIVLIYNPTLTTGTITTTNFEVEYGSAIDINIPFTLTGSMSVSNLNAPANQVIAQLSDANGSFDNPIEIGRLTTNTSGTVSAKIPASVGDGKYKVRVVSTNYPMTAAPSSSEITIKRYYTIAFDEYDKSIAELTGDGKYYAATTENITVSAVAKNEDYQFLYWFEDGSVVSLDSEYTFKAEKSRILQVVFKKQYSVSISATDGGSVSTTGGMYGDGEGLTVTATPSEGYLFLNWTNENDAVVSENASYTFVVSANTALKANFVKYISISATTNISEAGAISGAGDIVCEGDEVEVSLYAASLNSDKYLFVNWTENGEVVSESATYTFTTSENRMLVANFVTRYTFDVAIEDGGEISGAGIYTEGNTVQLVAFAHDNYRFVGWYEADTLVSTNSMYEFVANADRSFEAKFIEQCTITLQLNIENAGVLTGSGTFDKGTETSVQFALNEGYEFSNWTINDEEVSKDLIYDLVVNESVTIVANCSVIPSYIISAVADPVSGGTITGAGSYLENKSVTLVAQANSGYSFVNWSENNVVVSEETTMNFAAIENRSLVAHFEANFVGHTVALSSDEGGFVSGAGLFEEGELVTVIAAPNDKYEFQNWTINDVVVSFDATYSFELTSDIELTAHFSRIYDSFSINVTSADESMGIVQGMDSYQEEEIVVVSAVPNAGYRFVQWTENGSSVSTDAEYSFVCSEERNLVAEFMKIYTITIDEFVGGTVKGLNTGTFDDGAMISLAVIVDDNHRFVAWKDADNDEVLSTTMTYSFVADADKHLAVELKEKGQMYTISVSTGGVVAGLNNGQFEAGETVTLVATAADGYLFKGWVKNGEIISSEPILSFVADGSINLFAEFVAKPKFVDVDVEVNDETFGTITGAGSYFEGDEVMLIATPAPGYEFVLWTKDGKPLSNLTTLYFTVVEDCMINAEFKFIEKTAIDDVEQNVEISVVNHQIVVDGEIIPQFVFDVQGRKLVNNNLKAGIYFVKIESRFVGVSIR